MTLKEWFGTNWDKMLLIMGTVLGTLWGSWKRFSGRIEGLERKISGLEQRISTVCEDLDAMKIQQEQLEDDLVSRLEKLASRLDEILNLKVYVERNDALLKQIQEDVRELRGDFKTILSMR